MIEATRGSGQLTNLGSGRSEISNGVKGPLHPDYATAQGNSAHPTMNGEVKAQRPDGLATSPNGQYHMSQAQNGHQTTAPVGTQDIAVLCGPLLNFRRLDYSQQEDGKWHGSVLLVTKPGRTQPELRVRPSVQGGQVPDEVRVVGALKLHEASDKTFWCFELEIPIQDVEARWEYTVSHTRSISPKIFNVPARNQSMRIMFHSCNGFSVGTDEEAWSGPALWNDVLREHGEKPFHVMIGGGDQIYNDGVRVDGPLREWADMRNPKKRRDHQFGGELQVECDLFYFENYSKWYSTKPFATANGQIPQINIWDDHGRPQFCLNTNVTGLMRWIRYH